VPRVAPEASVIPPQRHGAGARHHPAATAKPAEFVALLGETDEATTPSPGPQGSLIAAASGLPGSVQSGATTGGAQPSVLSQIAPESTVGESVRPSPAIQLPAPAATADIEGGTELKEAKAPKVADATISPIDDAKPAEADTTAVPVPTPDGTAPAQPVIVTTAQVTVIAAPLPAAMPIPDPPVVDGPIPDPPVVDGPILPAREGAPGRAAIVAELAAPNDVATAVARGAPPEVAQRPAAEDGKAQPPRKGGAGLGGIEARRSKADNATRAGHAKPGGSPDRDDATPAASGDEQDDSRLRAQAGPTAPAAGKSEVARARPMRPLAPEIEQKLGETSVRLPAETQAGGTPDKPADVAQLAVPPQPGERAANVVATAAPATGYTAGSIPTAVPIAGLALQIAARAQPGSNRFEIRLDPPELGRIDVRLDVDREGRVSSRLVADKAETLDLLRREAPELERALQQAGLKTSDSGMQFTLRDQSSGGANRDTADGYWRSGAAKLVVQDAEMPAVDSLPGNRDRTLRLGTGIDIRV
jgi:flagellar hook-length control protein FliK